eukprot:6883-Heterococcus_DN1.PRE.2
MVECKFYKKNKCNRGGACKFEHSDATASAQCGGKGNIHIHNSIHAASGGGAGRRGDCVDICALLALAATTHLLVASTTAKSRISASMVPALPSTRAIPTAQSTLAARVAALNVAKVTFTAANMSAPQMAAQTIMATTYATVKTTVTTTCAAMHTVAVANAAMMIAESLLRGAMLCTALHMSVWLRTASSSTVATDTAAIIPVQLTIASLTTMATRTATTIPVRLEGVSIAAIKTHIAIITDVGCATMLVLKPVITARTICAQ